MTATTTRKIRNLKAGDIKVSPDGSQWKLIENTSGQNDDDYDIFWLTWEDVKIIDRIQEDSGITGCSKVKILIEENEEVSNPPESVQKEDVADPMDQKEHLERASAVQWALTEAREQLGKLLFKERVRKSLGINMEDSLEKDIEAMKQRTAVLFEMHEQMK